MLLFALFTSLELNCFKVSINHSDEKIMNLPHLIESISQATDYFQREAVRQVNSHLTLRNWVIGLYLFEYEQKGQDRAQYGERLYQEIAKRLKHRKGMSKTQLYRFKDFYLTYPQIFPTVSGKLQIIDSQYFTTYLPHPSTLTKQDSNLPFNDAQSLIERLSFSHFLELLDVDTPIQRIFYEVETIKNNWDVRDLRRAIETSLYERTGLSTDKAAVIEKIKLGKQLLPHEVIRNPYILEFLELDEKAEYSESDLETAIINDLQRFLIELGRGFCFEARQKRLSFDNKHYHIDLVFYHRILKCHVLVDLKIGTFDHADAGQMDMYLNYFTDNEMTEGDNPPVGLILCAKKNESLVRYATGNLPQQVFVSKYLLNLPDELQLKAFIEAEQNKLF
jgi:predicted nuclease of restriction endonuclease-like (RecB) superfamily